jgi:hypothetical protein
LSVFSSVVLTSKISRGKARTTKIRYEFRERKPTKIEEYKMGEVTQH